MFEHSCCLYRGMNISIPHRFHPQWIWNCEFLSSSTVRRSSDNQRKGQLSHKHLVAKDIGSSNMRACLDCPQFYCEHVTHYLDIFDVRFTGIMAWPKCMAHALYEEGTVGRTYSTGYNRLFFAFSVGYFFSWRTVADRVTRFLWSETTDTATIW